MTAKEYREQFCKADKKPLPAVKSKPVVKDMPEAEPPEVDGSGVSEPLIRRVLSAVVIGKSLPGAHVDFHPEHLIITIDHQKFQLSIKPL